IRTLDIHLGKVTLYQAELRSLPKRRRNGRETGRYCKPRFCFAFRQRTQNVEPPDACSRTEDPRSAENDIPSRILRLADAPPPSPASLCHKATAPTGCEVARI